MSNTPEAKIDYSSTLNLPQTDFLMKADLPNREPVFLKRWEDEKLYEALVQKNNGRPKFVLHDGPPYANGTIHFGHILNKVLKDIIVKYKNLSGHLAEYVPGWDCHGLPIELNVDKKLGDKKRDMPPADIRRACRAYAQEFIDVQRRDFKRMGILGRWQAPYLTMDARYEATIAREIGKIRANGFLDKGYKPVHWCASCGTALAEAEVEYDTKRSPAIFVLFKAPTLDIGIDFGGRTPFFVIWTTTPWTLPANVAIAVGETFTYVAASLDESRAILVAKDLLPALEKTLGRTLPVLGDVSGEHLAKHTPTLEAEHPFLDRRSRVVSGHHVSLDTGTGLVHIAPGHGIDDYKIGLEHQLETIMPVNARGKFTRDVGIAEWEGESVFQVNGKVIERLQENDRLLHHEEIDHAYPHCWRCKKPVIFRATEQWFVLLDQIGKKATINPPYPPFSKGDETHTHDTGKLISVREQALSEINRLHWIPDWGKNRIHAMVSDRPDWCVSRQRLWGVPIPAFYCDKGHLLFTEAIVEHIATLFENHTSDVWYEKEANDLLPAKTTCIEPGCGSTTFTKDANILDVWFDSGVSHAAVLALDPTLTYPADLYLEGSDQHRGWFHSSLLTAVATRGEAPYKAVLTHGFVVDEQGRKYSKSAQNYLPPETILKTMGAELLRLWVSSEDYRNDIRLSKNHFDQLGDAYRKIRNTCRFMLGNLFDFNPTTDLLPLKDRLEIDRFALSAHQTLIQTLNEAYEQYEFHRVYQELTRYAIVNLSAFYLDILKDRLYTFKKDGLARRSAQSTLYEIVRDLSILMAPILSFTAEDIWQFIPMPEQTRRSIFLSDFPKADTQKTDSSLEKKWLRVTFLRNDVLKALELARKDKLINHSLEAKVMLSKNHDFRDLETSLDMTWESVFITSQVAWCDTIDAPTYTSGDLAGLHIKITRAEGTKCPRCWNYATTIGADLKHPDLCGRCVSQF